MSIASDFDLAANLPKGITLLGCGKMGGSLLQGWLAAGVPASAVTVIDPYPAQWLQDLVGEGLKLNPASLDQASVCVLAVKPQMMAEAIGQVKALAASGSLFLSIAAGTKIAYFEEIFGKEAAIVRTMPNLPVSVGRGVTALIENAAVSDAQMALADALCAAVGETVRLENEDQMDAVTGVSGSGPAYVFNMIEAMTAAGVAAGLSEDMSLALARNTIFGAAELARQSEDTASQLRINVTSPAGTTAAALAVLMDEKAGLEPLMTRAVAAAADRSRELAN